MIEVSSEKKKETKWKKSQVSCRVVSEMQLPIMSFLVIFFVQMLSLRGYFSKFADSRQNQIGVTKF